MSTHDGGKPNVKPNKYSPPVGPINLHEPGPGLGGGTNIGQGQTFHDHDGAVGHPGLEGGNNHGNSGSQGEH
jgi:hypothetical protein